jgi:hypothetical protein
MTFSSKEVIVHSRYDTLGNKYTTDKDVMFLQGVAVVLRRRTHFFF